MKLINVIVMKLYNTGRHCILAVMKSYNGTVKKLFIIFLKCLKAYLSDNANLNEEISNIAPRYLFKYY